MNKHAVLALFLCLATVQARLFHDDALASAGRSLSAVACPAGCAPNACVPDSTNTGFVCTQCNAGINLNSVDGTCECPPGRWADTTTDLTCKDCTKTNYCPGGIYGGVNTIEYSCNDPTIAAVDSAAGGLTTRGQRSKSVAACINAPGHFFSVVGGKPKATVCPVDSYSPGLKKQQGCVACPSGFKTLGVTTSFNIKACRVPMGFYLRGPGEVAPCPKGEYQATNTTVGQCTKCEPGVTTEYEQSVSNTDCNWLLPSYYAKTIVGGEIRITAKCPQNTYCPGGLATAELNPSNPSETDTSVKVCPSGLWTEKYGAVDLYECMTPPGYYTSGTSTLACPAGSYRADWKNPAEATACDSCGNGINSEPIDKLTTYAATNYAESTIDVATGSGSCYIDAGQGMYYNPTTKNFTVVNCNTDNYGVANKTYGLGGFACRQCPTNMQATQLLSGAYSATNGFTDPLACVTTTGYGYNGRIATQCAIDAWNPAGNRLTCTKCPYGTRTDGTAPNQGAETNCGIAEGFGFHNSVIQPCPMGTYNDVRRTDQISPCTSCGDGLTTSQSGGRSATDCNMCKPGYGGATNCTLTCGGGTGASATYGPAGRPLSDSSACVACPYMNETNGFTFNYNSQSNNYNPDPIARSAAESSADCLSSYAQLAQGNWYMGGAAAGTVNAAGNWADCVTACGESCAFLTFDYSNNECKIMAPGTNSGFLTAVKAIQAGDITAANKKTASTPGAKALSSGSYTFWKDDGSAWGKTTAAGNNASIEACLLSCDTDVKCAAVVMTDMSASTSKPTLCTKIYGDDTAGSSKRGVTRVKLSALVVTAVLT